MPTIKKQGSFEEIKDILKNAPKKSAKAQSLKKTVTSKINVLKKMESILKKSFKQLTKDLNNVLKDADVWYCSDDYIKYHEELRKPNDRNGDQIILDYATTIVNGGELWSDDIKKLWTKEDIENDDKA